MQILRFTFQWCKTDHLWLHIKDSQFVVNQSVYVTVIFNLIIDFNHVLLCRDIFGIQMPTLTAHHEECALAALHHQHVTIVFHQRATPRLGGNLVVSVASRCSRCCCRRRCCCCCCCGRRRHHDHHQRHHLFVSDKKWLSNSRALFPIADINMINVKIYTSLNRLKWMIPRQW